MKTNVIGYKDSIEERKINWAILLSLREQLKFYNENPNAYAIAKEKQGRAYKKFFTEYVK